MDGQPGVLSVFTGGAPGGGAEQILEIVAAAKAAQHGNFGDGVICHQQHLGGLAQPDVIHMLFERLPGDQPELAGKIGGAQVAVSGHFFQR